MKTNIRKLILILLFIVAPVSMIMADGPGPPSPGGDPSGTGGQPIGAPIDGGFGILLVIGAAYGGIKLYRSKKKEKEPVPEES
jgi:hypothetical protein